MTTDPIAAKAEAQGTMTDHDINRVLAEKVMGWEQRSTMWVKRLSCGDAYMRPTADTYREDSWTPAECRNDLAEVLGKLSETQWVMVLASFGYDGGKIDAYGTKFLLTCDPSIIARAVAEVVR